MGVCRARAPRRASHSRLERRSASSSPRTHRTCSRHVVACILVWVAAILRFIGMQRRDSSSLRSVLSERPHYIHAKTASKLPRNKPHHSFTFAPQRIALANLSQTKTYMHQFVDSPNGKMYAFRQFPGTKQPMASTGQNALGWPCEIWLCKSDLTGHFKAFTSPTTEGGHGSDVIVWVNDDLIYYAGISFRISEKKIIWQFDGKTSHLPLARANPVHERKLYVSVRGNEEPQYQSLRENSVMSEGRGWFWLDPSSRSKPNLNLVSNMKDLVQYYDGLWENAEATYIYQNPTDTKLFVVIYDRLMATEFAFVLNEKDGSVHSYLGRNSIGASNNGHVLWIDDNTLFAGNQNPGLFNANGTLINRPLSGVSANHISVSSDGKFWVADIEPDHSISLFMFGSKHAITINGGITYDHPHPSFSRDGRYVFFQGKESPGDRVAVYRVDVSFAMVQLKQMAEAATNSIEKRWSFNAPDKNTKETMRVVRSSADSGIPGTRIGAKVSADWQLRGEYYDGVVAGIPQEGRSVTIEYDDDGSIETLPFDHVRERTITEERYPIQINDKVLANWESRGEYYAGTVTAVSPNRKSIEVQYDDDNSLETLPLGYIRIPWRNLNEQGRTSAKFLGFTELTWNEGSHPAAHLTPFDSLSTVEQNAARYLGLEPQFVSFTPPISICFVSASYGVDVSKLSPHADVTKLRDSNPTHLFFLFTNLEELPGRGWTKIITDLPYNRFITHSRYGKFLAWEDQTIQQSCQVVFYHDTTLSTKDVPIHWQNLAKNILESPHGLMQIPHERNVESRRRGTHVLIDEMNTILRDDKDIFSHELDLMKWFSGQNVFAKGDCFLFENDFFGYNPKSTSFQRVSRRFWERYSQELDSWRDQPYWCFFMDEENISPLLLQHDDKPNILIKHKRIGHNGHTYNLDSDNDALVWRSLRENATFKWQSQTVSVPSTSLHSNSSWEDLDEKAKEGAIVLGFSEGSWDNNFLIPLYDTLFEDLSKEQQLAARYLGIEQRFNFTISASSDRRKGRDKTLFFIAQHPEWGSAKMRGLHFIDEWTKIDQHLQKHGETEWIYGLHKCGSILPCADICVFIGPCDVASHLRDSCCKIKVLDIVDKYLFRQVIIDETLYEYDALIVNSNFMKDYFIEKRNFTGEIFVVLHHSDPRWHNVRTTNESESIIFGYSGSLPSLHHTDNFLHWQDLMKRYPITFVDTDSGILPEQVDFQCDLSIRPLGTPVSQFKTSAKVATAAALGHNIITTWDEAVKDCLPKNYPFLLHNTSLLEVQKMMDKVSADYEGNRHLWNTARRMMEEVNAKLSLSSIAPTYHGYLLGML